MGGDANRVVAYQKRFFRSAILSNKPTPFSFEASAPSIKHVYESLHENALVFLSPEYFYLSFIVYI